MPARDHPHTAAASLEILTGPARGTLCWLEGSTLDLSLDAENRLRVAEPGNASDAARAVARLHRSDDSYEIEARGESLLWINGKAVTQQQLAQRDLVEFGDAGPLTRFRLYYQGDRRSRSLGDMLDDAIDYTRFSRRPTMARVPIALRDLLHDFTLRTTLVFRVGVIVALVILGVIAYQQYRAGIALQQQAESSAHRLEGFARTLTRASEEALRPADLNRLRQELRQSLSVATERLEELEKRTEASKRIIAEATRAIVFLQGAYGYRDAASKRPLRYQADADGQPLFSLRGQPLLTLEGEGEIVEVEFTGTAFAINAGGALLTNRHVAQPWEDDAGLQTLLSQGMEPVLFKFLGYLPGVEQSFPLALLKASEEADLAILQIEDVAAEIPYLRLGKRSPQPGDAVIVMGYPTGMRAMLAQTGEAFLAELEQQGSIDFWGVAESLARAQFIRPLASRGIISQRSSVTLVYDADTTHGGSGGPVLDINGDAVAVNTSIIPEYGGSNFGVPVEFARRLLDEAGLAID